MFDANRDGPDRHCDNEMLNSLKEGNDVDF